MKYHTLYFSKTEKDVAKLSSAAVVIGVLRVKNHKLVNGDFLFIYLFFFFFWGGGGWGFRQFYQSASFLKGH